MAEVRSSRLTLLGSVEDLRRLAEEFLWRVEEAEVYGFRMPYSMVRLSGPEAFAQFLDDLEEVWKRWLMVGSFAAAGRGRPVERVAYCWWVRFTGGTPEGFEGNDVRRMLAWWLETKAPFRGRSGVVFVGRPRGTEGNVLDLVVAMTPHPFEPKVAHQDGWRVLTKSRLDFVRDLMEGCGEGSGSFGGNS
ncbi:hypothetical protein [Thermosulfurimonas sp. F29]|uniref:hypothetical protein n=1 Tax=Thermosulfurimonas sp. F29 TaxID=2867247 RepID=UPI001C83E169|nr:hypothetical protein [Thermosulfurimonas sp. F29]MBX6423363.1 hypothetical protein [Thermosulfurimonas sp. F29]